MRLADERDRALAAEIVLGTLRWRAALDHVIAWAGQRSIDAFDAEVLDILRLSPTRSFISIACPPRRPSTMP